MKQEDINTFILVIVPWVKILSNIFWRFYHNAIVLEAGEEIHRDILEWKHYNELQHLYLQTKTYLNLIIAIQKTIQI